MSGFIFRLLVGGADASSSLQGSFGIPKGEELVQAVVGLELCSAGERLAGGVVPVHAGAVARRRTQVGESNPSR